MPDECDITAGTSQDCNANARPDECENLPTGVLYVDDDATGGLNDGSNWTNAYIELADALSYATCAGPISEVRVSGGTYKPSVQSEPGVPKTETFQLINGVAIRGGYRGLAGGGDPDDRDIAGFPTLLSGDLGGEGASEDMCYHVVTGSGTDATAVLDGVTVSAGYAYGPPPHDCGGGIRNDNGNPTLTNCTFQYNWANNNGGGMHNNNSSPALTNCTFASASADYGGGMYNYNNSSPTLTTCTFSENLAFDHGGALYNNNSSPTLTDCTFSGNDSWDNGGALYNNNSGPALTNCAFSENSAEELGGGMYNANGSSLMLTDCTFSGNDAWANGGGMYNTQSSLTLTTCTFSGNSADDYGGAMYNTQCNPTLTNCTFIENSVTATHSRGGGMYNTQSSPTLTNCTFSENSPFRKKTGRVAECPTTTAAVRR